MSDFRSPDTIRYQQSLYHRRVVEDEARGLPPGYIMGFEPAIEDESVRYTPGIANILGQRVVKDESTWITDMTWRVTKINAAYYTIYLDRYGAWFVDNQSPAVLTGHYGLYHPITGERYVGTIFVDADGNYSGVVSHKRIRAEDLDANAITADSIAAGSITADKLEADILNILIAEITEYITVDSEGFIAESGDWRALITENKFAIQQDVAGVWTDRLKMGVSTGGLPARMFYGGGLVGVLNDPYSLDIGDSYPTGSNLFTFDSGFTDHAGADPWDTKTDVEIDGTGGLYVGALKSTSTSGALVHSSMSVTRLDVCQWVKPGTFSSVATEEFVSPWLALSGGGVASSLKYDADTDRNGVFVVTSTASLLYRSADHGETWTEIDTSLIAGGLLTYRAVATDRAGTWIAGAAGVVIRSTDNGVSWPAIPAYPHASQIYGIATDANGVWVAVGSGGEIARSTNNGVDWTDISAAYPHSNVIYAVATDEAGTWMAGGGPVGGPAELAISTDDGETWTAITTLPYTPTRVYAIETDGAGKWAVSVIDGSFGRFLVTEDGGTSWTQRNGIFGSYYDSIETDGSGKWIVGQHDGRFFTTDNNTSTWLWSGDSEGLTAPILVNIADRNGAWIIGESSTLIREKTFTVNEPMIDISSDTHRLAISHTAENELTAYLVGNFTEETQVFTITDGEWVNIGLLLATGGPVVVVGEESHTFGAIDDEDLTSTVLSYHLATDEMIDDLIIVDGGAGGTAASTFISHSTNELPWAGTDIETDIVLKGEPTGKIVALDQIVARYGLDAAGAAYLDQTTVDGIATFTTNVLMTDLPTSSVGLPSGSLWNDSGTVKVVT